MDRCLLCGESTSFRSTVGPISVDGLCDKDSCKVCREMSELNERIVEVRRQLASLVAAQLHLKTRQNEAHDPFILRLPSEISSTIFTLCIDFQTAEEVYRGSGWYRDPSGTRPIDIASTCKGWRAIALSTPQLWTRMDIFLHHPEDTHQAYLEYQTRLLSRSGSLPFSFSLRPSITVTVMTSRLFALIPLLNQHSTRWEFVVVYGIVFILSQLTGCGKPSNALLGIVTSDSSYAYSPNDAKFRLIGGNPAPQYVKLRSLSFRSFHVNWSKSTHVDLHHAFITDFHNLLQEATQLESLLLGLYPNIDNAQFNSIRKSVPMILCPCLKELVIRNADESTLPSIVDIFGMLFLPKLDYLCLESFDNGFVGLSAVLARSSSPLRHLKLDDSSGYHDDMVNELSKIPSIQTLEVWSFDPRAILRKLAATRNVNYFDAAEEPFLPKLTTLLFKYTVDDISMPWSLLPSIFPLTFAEGQRPLRCLEFAAQDTNEDEGVYGSTHSYIPEPELEAFQSLIDRGFSLIIRAPDYQNTTQDFIEISREFHEERLLVSKGS